MISSRKLRVLAAALTLTLVGGCYGVDDIAKHKRPLSQEAKAELRDKGMRTEDPILVRIFKEDNELEIWKKREADGRYAHFRTYEICAWSGELGPKLAEGDRQAPEGFYTVTPAQMNPNSSYHLSFNIGFPNKFDRSHGRTGSHLMVHGDCSSAGCYAMTDPVIEEIYALAREAFRGGQREFQIQAYPFRMTPENMARHADSPHMPFWRNLKEGNDHFEVTGVPPEVAVCERQYVFNANSAEPGRRLVPNAACPRLEVPSHIDQAVAAKQMRDETKFQIALAEIRSQQQPTQMSEAPTMVAYEGITEQGSAMEGDEEAAVAAAPATAEGTSGQQPASARAFSPVGDAFAGVWNRLVTLTGGAAQPASAAAAQAPSDLQAPDVEASGAGTGAELPRGAASYAPQRFERDTFAVFSLFETVDGASVPADMIRR